MVVLLMLVSRIESNSDEEIDISARRLRKNEDDADSGYPFADALIKYPYRQSNNNKWAIIFHVLGICYMMLGLNIVCDAYFCEALTCMCSAWNIQEDVAVSARSLMMRLIVAHCLYCYLGGHFHGSRRQCAGVLHKYNGGVCCQGQIPHPLTLIILIVR
jgi:hypothetical protein